MKPSAHFSGQRLLGWSMVAGALSLLAAIDYTNALDSRYPKYQDYLSPPAVALPEGSFPCCTFIQPTDIASRRMTHESIYAAARW